MNLNKGVPTWLIILAGLAIGVVFIYKDVWQNKTLNKEGFATAAPAQDVDMADWTVYKSQDDNYEVSYPANWKEQSSGGQFIVTSKAGNGAPSADINFSVRVEKKSNNNFSKILDQFSRLYNLPNGSSDSGKVKLQNMMVAGSPSIKLLQLPGEASGGVSSLNYEVKADDETYYYLSFIPFNDETWTKNSVLITYIVESFKFILPLMSTLTPTAADVKN